jgi:hypothetical protein
MLSLKKIILLLLLGTLTTIHAQEGFSPEIGIIAGPVAFQSDYGQRNNLDTNLGNTGFGIGFVYFFNFSYLNNYNFLEPNGYFSEHFKLRAELSYNRTKLNHFGQEVAPAKLLKSAEARKIAAMSGITSLFNIGAQIEYYPFKTIRYFEATNHGFAPFLSIGGQFSFYTPKTTSTLGDLGTPLTTFSKYLYPSDGEPHGYTSKSGTVFSIVSSVGTRYKLGVLSDLMIDLRLQYYFSNWVDGLNPNQERFPENKANDWNVWLNVGYIYYLD